MPQDVELCNEVTIDAIGELADEASATEMLFDDAATAGLELSKVTEDTANISPNPSGVGVKVVV